MTSTSFNVGLGSASRNSSKVLKPPGGGSSDIFGTSNDPEPQQRKVRNHLTSSIFGGEDGQTPARNKAGNDSFYNLFGAEPQSQSRPGTAVKDKFKSNIVLDDVKLDAKKSLAFSEDGSKTETDNGTVLKGVESEDGPETSGVHKSEDVETNGVYKTDDVETNGVHKNGLEDEGKEEGNQVTTNGDKAETVVNGSSSASSVASTPASAPTAAAAAPSAPAASAAASRQRVPPGGFSSGLW